ncbi:hypothetical protein EON79_14065 [bacterium]|nr:MAG: hypothetical protein EON79_14065 [bacterium]
MVKPLQPALPFEPMRATAKSIRRRVFRWPMHPAEDGTYTFRARSFSRQGGRAYRVMVNPHSGHVSCQCPDFTYRKSALGSTYFGGQVCKHLERAIRTVRKVEKARDIGIRI